MNDDVNFILIALPVFQVTDAFSLPHGRLGLLVSLPGDAISTVQAGCSLWKQAQSYAIDKFCNHCDMSLVLY
jgi:hypothetical protein